MQNRIDRIEHYRELIHVYKKRSTCLRRHVGAIAIKDDHIIATGYNGAPKNITHCTKESCLRKNIPSGQRHEMCMAVHAEQNLITQAAYHGHSLKDSVVFCTNKPCFICTKLLINAGVKMVVYEDDYPDEMTDSILEQTEMIFMTFDELINSKKEIFNGIK